MKEIDDLIIKEYNITFDPTKKKDCELISIVAICLII